MAITAWPEIFGYLAASLLLLTFFMRQMVPLRAMAIAASAAWVVYGWADHIYPVLCLHVVLLPVNGTRLYQGLRGQGAAKLNSVGAAEVDSSRLRIIQKSSLLPDSASPFGHAELARGKAMLSDFGDG